jgi:hypothetical protein
MQKFFFLFVLCFLSFSSLFGQMVNEDSVIWMSKSRAESVAARLQKEKYVLNYCDCCTNREAAIIKIGKVEVENSSQDDTLFAVRVTGEEVFVLSVDVSGTFYSARAEDSYYYNLASLNTWFLPMNGRALPMQHVMGLPEQPSCQYYLYFPFPDEEIFAEISTLPSVIEYTKWHNKVLPKATKIADLIGEWQIFEWCREYGECIPLPGTASASMLLMKSGDYQLKVNGSVDASGKWRVDKGVLVLEGKDKKEHSAYMLEEGILFLKSLDIQSREEFLVAKAKKKNK